MTRSLWRWKQALKRVYPEKTSPGELLDAIRDLHDGGSLHELTDRAQAGSGLLPETSQTQPGALKRWTPARRRSWTSFRRDFCQGDCGESFHQYRNRAARA